ncbi:MAG: FkbM family methyltransferase [Capsulimonadaceae bacterium]|nr:FkbM family methyltransferase [Capsulimonadaceae bacterium]
MPRRISDAATNAQRYLRGWCYIRDTFWLECMIRHHIWPAGFTVDKHGQLRLPGVETPVPRLHAERVVPTLPSRAILERIGQHGATFDFDPVTGPVVTANGVSLLLDGHGVLETFDEVVIREFYRTTLRRPTVVWDIGMNVGLASLYFAANSNVEAVYGYEPFKQTFDSAVANFRINREIAGKIVPRNMGISSKSYSTTALYHIDYSAALGVEGVAVDVNLADFESQTIELLSAVDVYNDIRARHPDAALLIKMDCEGSERSIIPALLSLDSLRDRVQLNIETHFDCHTEILAQLEAHGFKAFGLATEYPGVWLLHAVSNVEW